MPSQFQSVGAIVLAAGESSRLGQPKQLLQFKGKALVRRVVDAANEANCSPIIVVTGNAQSEIKHTLQPTNAAIVENKWWKAGIGTSIRAGVRYLIDNAPNAYATLLLTCDQPFVDRDLLSGLIALHSKTGKPIVASAYADTLGVPVLFDRSMFHELSRLDGDSGAKTIILSNHACVAEFLFPRGNIDVDTTQDFESIARKR
jgi:molybdenum cofactor cytidylyltransferase